MEIVLLLNSFLVDFLNQIPKHLILKHSALCTELCMFLGNCRMAGATMVTFITRYPLQTLKCTSPTTTERPAAEQADVLSSVLTTAIEQGVLITAIQQSVLITAITHGKGVSRCVESNPFHSCQNENMALMPSWP